MAEIPTEGLDDAALAFAALAIEHPCCTWASSCTFYGKFAHLHCRECLHGATHMQSELLINHGICNRCRKEKHATTEPADR